MTYSRAAKVSCAFAIAALNIGFCADIIQASEKQSQPGNTNRPLSDLSYSGRITVPWVEANKETFGNAGELFAHLALMPFLTVGLPGAIAGTVISENLYQKPAL